MRAESQSTIRRKVNRMANDGGLQIKWETIIMGIGLVVVLVGGFWTLAYIPIDNNQKRLEQQFNDLRTALQHHMLNDESKYLTQKEHNEYKSNVHDKVVDQGKDVDSLRNEIAALRKETEARRAEIATRNDVQQALNTTRVEFLSEVKRLDQLVAGDMKREEFNVWQKEREKTIAAIQDRQNRFSEALDSMYSKLMQQMPSYQQKQ